jgi:predicted DNA-binding transcriptional regulator AlpA
MGRTGTLKAAAAAAAPVDAVAADVVLPDGLGQLATPKQVAAFLDVSEPNLGQLRYLGRGPKFIKITGRQVRYRWSDVLAWVEEQARVRT